MSRYPGTRPFSDSPDDVLRFFGRDAEAEELYLRVRSVPLLVQFGNSGLGKTSLLQAGLFPRLRQKPFLPVMIRLNNTGESLTAAVARAIRESCESEGIQETHRSTDGLWELLSSLTVWRDDLLLTPVLVFDQFEEVFTLRDAAFRAEIAAELGALFSGIPPARAAGTRRPAAKVVISLREDYLGALEEFSAAIPGLFQERLRLGPLTEEAARDAITGPAQIVGPGLSPPFEFDPAALDLMVTELKGKSGVIEPFQLQLLARHAETVAERKGGGRLTTEDFRGTQDFESVLKNFYRDTLQRVAQRAKVQRLVEEGLLGASGHRLMLEERQIRSDYGVTPETLQTLETSRLIRRERRLESVFYEISHDRIADSIFRGRTRRLPRNVRVALWTAAAIGVVIVAGLAWFNYRVSRERDKAQAAKRKAEELIAFLLGEEFLGEVRDIGRLSLLELVQANVQPGDRSPVISALAMRNAGDLARAQGRLQESIDQFTNALTIFTREPDDDDVQREIARTHERLADAVSERGNVSDAVTHADAAVRWWERVPKESDDCISLAGALVRAADARQRLGQTDVALQNLDRASGLLSDMLFGARNPRSDCKPSPRAEPYPDGAMMDMLSRVVFARATYLDTEEDYAGAVALAERARKLRLTSSDVEKHALTSTVMRAAAEDDPAVSLRDYRTGADGFRDLSRWDPSNVLWQRESADAQLQLSYAIVKCRTTSGCDGEGTLDEAEALALQALGTMRILAAADPGNEMWQDDVAWGLETHATVLAARKQFPEAQLRLDEARKVRSAISRDPADTEPIYHETELQIARARTFGAAGDKPRASEALLSAIARLTRLTDAQPQNLVALDRLVNAWSLRFTMLGNADARAEGERLREKFNAALMQIDKPIWRLDFLTSQSSGRAMILSARGDYAAALREFAASEDLLRKRIALHPAGGGGYQSLRAMYETVAHIDGGAGDPAGRGIALQAAVRAARIAQSLDHDSVESIIASRNVTHVFGTFLFERKRFDEAVAVIKEAITLAGDVAQRPGADAAAWWYLGNSEGVLGRLRRESGRAGWQESLSSAIIHLRTAAAMDPRYADELQEWMAYASEGATATGPRPRPMPRP